MARVGRYWRAERLGWWVNFTDTFPDTWIEMENIHDYWRLTERGAKRLARRLEARA